MSGIVIAGTHSGCGKTTITLGMMAALRNKGMKVQPFKAGPDFIDSGLHRMITGRLSRNLDLWMCGEGYVRDCFIRNSYDCDISVVEGVMGLLDGDLSTATLSAKLSLPVVLVVDAYGMAETAAAVVRGVYQTGLEHGVAFAGVVFNRVASERHYQRLCREIEDLPVLGYLPRKDTFEIPHRHLGLTTAEDDPIPEEKIQQLADVILKHVDMDEIVRRAGLNNEGAYFPRSYEVPRPVSDITGPVIAVARDKAFCFYYQDNLDLLRDAGARIVWFSPLSDPTVPEEADGVYIGGGYPELHAEALSGNLPMLESIRAWSEEGRPLYAECGGLMYLSMGIHDFEGRFFGMSGVFPFETRMKKGRSRLGYRQVVLKQGCIVGRAAAEMRGHEFHYSEVAWGREKNPSLNLVYSLKDGSGETATDEGYRNGNTLASYVHLHFGSNPGIARAIVGFCRK